MSVNNSKEKTVNNMEEKPAYIYTGISVHSVQGKVGGDKSGVQVPPTISNPPTCPLAVDVVIISYCFTVY